MRSSPIIAIVDAMDTMDGSFGLNVHSSLNDFNAELVSRPSKASSRVRRGEEGLGTAPAPPAQSASPIGGRPDA